MSALGYDPEPVPSPSSQYVSFRFILTLTSNSFFMAAFQEVTQVEFRKY
jgi:hypothetical protein